MDKKSIVSIITFTDDRDEGISSLEVERFLEKRQKQFELLTNH